VGALDKVVMSAYADSVAGRRGESEKEKAREEGSEEEEKKKRKGDQPEEVEAIREYIKSAKTIVVPTTNEKKVNAINSVLKEFGIAEAKQINLKTDFEDLTRMPVPLIVVVLEMGVFSLYDVQMKLLPVLHILY